MGVFRYNSLRLTNFITKFRLFGLLSLCSPNFAGKDLYNIERCSLVYSSNKTIYNKIKIDSKII